MLLQVQKFIIKLNKSSSLAFTRCTVRYRYKLYKDLVDKQTQTSLSSRIYGSSSGSFDEMKSYRPNGVMSISRLLNLTFVYKSQYGRKLHSESPFKRVTCRTKRNSLFKKVIVFDQKMSSCTTTWSTFEVYSLKTDTTSCCFFMLSFLTSSALIFWTLRAGSSFLTVLLVLGKCITAVPAAMLEMTLTKFETDRDAKRDTVLMNGQQHYG